MNGELKYLAQSYFHQDYRDEYANAEATLAGYVERESAESVADLRADVEEVLSNDADARIAVLWKDDLRSSYYPEDDGITCRQWFERMRTLLTEPGSA